MACPGIGKNDRPCAGKLYHIFHHETSSSVTDKIEESIKRESTWDVLSQEQIKKLKPEEETNPTKTDNPDIVHLVNTSYNESYKNGNIIYAKENSNVVYLNPGVYEESKTGHLVGSNLNVCPLCGSVLKIDKPAETKESHTASKKVA